MPYQTGMEAAEEERTAMQLQALSLIKYCHKSCKQEKGVAPRSSADTTELKLTKLQNMPGES
jgi:hypothetical protein